MQQYKLLRNNMESGPYGFQDLIDLQLKAYDLLWLVGKSVSWKYPSEIDEFKLYAPAVQDDLYIQFHTPYSAWKSNSTKESLNGQKLPRTKKYVSVILPSGEKKSFSSPKILQPEEIFRSIPLSKQEPVQMTGPIQKSMTVTEKSITSEKFVVENFIAVPESTYTRQYQRYYIAAAFLVLLTGSIYFGTSHQAGSNINQPVKVPEAAPEVATALVQLASRELNNNTSIETPDSEDPVPFPSNKILDFASLKRFIEVKPIKYSVGMFGGISDLQFSVKNTGKQSLKNVVIAVDFLLKDKSVHHSENIQIPSIPAQHSEIVAAPVSKKGVAFQTRIIGVNDLFIR
jgi:hypothetical protein